MGEEVPRSRRQALGSLVYPVGGSPWPLGSKIIIQYHMDQNINNPPPRVVVDQAPEGDQSGLGSAAKVPVSGRGDVLLLHNLPDGLTYRGIHDLFRSYGTVSRIRLVYERNGSSNRCYVTFSSSAEAKSAFEALGSLSIGVQNLKAELLSSRNVTESDVDYVPNIFEQALKDSSPKIREAPIPRWFVGDYRDGTGNFIRASRYLNKEIGHIPPQNLKKYGKGVLIKAKDLTQAKMLLHFQCPENGIFEAIKPHRTFNYSKGTVYNYDLYDFSEEEILSMCPREVQKVSKIKGRGNMIILTFYGSSIQDYVQIGPLHHLRVKPFVDRPLQCFRCYEFGHGKNKCTRPIRCGHCSKLDSHNINECDAEAYCFHCRANHSLRSRECPRYRLEQDILHYANQNFISLGSARRELAYRQGKGGGPTSYAVSLGSRSSTTALSKATNRPLPTSSTTSSPTPSSSGVSVRNQFSALDMVNEANTKKTSSDNVQNVPTTVTRVNQSPSHKSKRHHSSTESVELQQVPPHKKYVTSPKRAHAPENILPASMKEATRSPVYSPNNCTEEPCDVGETDMKGVDNMPLVDENLLIDLARQVSHESLTSVSQAGTHVEPEIDEASNLGSGGSVNDPVSLPEMETSLNAAACRPSTSSHTPVTSFMGSGEVTRPTFPSHKTDATSVGNASVNRFGSSSHKPVTSSMGSVEVTRPASPSHIADATSVGNDAVNRPNSRSHKTSLSSMRKAEVPRPGYNSHKLVKNTAPTKLNRVIKFQGKIGAGKSLSGTRPKTTFK